MFIKIENDVIDLLEKSKDQFDTCVMVIDKLFDSMLMGKHIVYSSAKNLKRITQVPLISERTRLYVSWILKEYPTIYGCKNIVDIYLLVSAKSSEVILNEDCFQIPLEYALDIRETKLLTEHESDAKFYIELSKYIQKKQRINTFYSISYENDSYHGTNGKVKIEQVAESKRIVLCVVDTDKDYPEGSHGDTYRVVKKAVNSAKRKIAIKLVELPVREKENLFPATIYKEFSGNGLIHVISDNYSDNEVIANYFDIKEGVKYKKYINRDEKWNKYFGELLSDCINEEICNNKLTMGDGDKYYIVGIGDKICDGVVDALFLGDKALVKRHFNSLSEAQRERIMKNRQNMLDSLPEFVIKNWETLSQPIFSWGCCIDRKRYPAQRDW